MQGVFSEWCRQSNRQHGVIALFVGDIIMFRIATFVITAIATTIFSVHASQPAIMHVASETASRSAG